MRIEGLASADAHQLVVVDGRRSLASAVSGNDSPMSTKMW